MDRRTLLAAGAGATLGLAPGAEALARARDEAPPGTLRVAFAWAEAGFDPPRVSDGNAIRVLSHIFEAPLAYDPLAQPARLVPCTAAAMPEVSPDYRRWVVTLRPGILFADDPAFGGRPRELTAADYVYSIKRYFDPAVRSENLYLWEGLKLLGANELRAQVLKARTPYPYDVELPGLRALDRYRFELRSAEPQPRLQWLLASAHGCGAVAREVIERYADDTMAHPVGTGPFRLAQWRRASRTVLERNPRFRGETFAAEPAADDAEGQALAAEMKGAALPALDRIEFSVIEESQPRWLAFLNGDIDILAVPPQFTTLAAPGGRLAAFLARRGVRMQRALSASTTHTFFNFSDPVVGGYDAPQVALRRAIALAYDTDEEIRVTLGGDALRAQSLIPPHCSGHDPGLVSELGRTDKSRAAALLDLYGFVDRNGDGFRERPDGRPLELRMATATTQVARQNSELWKKHLQAVGLRIRFEPAPFAELIRRSLAGQLQIWGFNWSAASPDGGFFLGISYGPNADQSNDARFRLPAFDRLYERQQALPDGPERLSLMAEATRLQLAYMPYIAHHHPITTDLLHPRVRGFRRHPFGSAWYRSMGLASL